MGHFIIGANGLVGAAVGRVLTAQGLPWTGSGNRREAAGLVKLDITRAAEVDAVLSAHSPSVVVHAANLAGGVDHCENNPAIATAFHLEATKAIGAWCQRSGARLVFVSTDYVFDGAHPPYAEDDEKNPLNLYGRLKLQAERWIEANVASYAIARTTNVFGWDPQTVTPNFLMGLVRALEAHKPFNAPSFLSGNPTYVGDLAEALVELSLEQPSGVYHVVGSSFVDRYEWAQAAAAAFGLDGALLVDVKAPSPTMIPRPLRSWLATDRFRATHRTLLRDMAEGLARMKADRTT